MAKLCGARRRFWSCRCSREPGHRGRHRCGRSGALCRALGPKRGRGPYTITAEWR